MTQSDWLARIETWVPKWMLEQSTHVTPILSAMATVMASNEAERNSLVAQTYIGQADTEYLDTLGEERDTPRLTPEVNSAYAARVRTKHIISFCDPISIKAAVDEVLIVGECTVVEDGHDQFFFTPGQYFNRGVVFQPLTVKDAFSILVDKQLHASTDFFNRGSYFNELAFYGDAGSSAAVFRSLINIVNDNRAFGAPFRVIERHT